MTDNAGKMKKKTNGRPFQKGWKGGPGRPPQPLALREAKRLNKTSFEALINKHLWATPEELQASLDSGYLPMVEAIVVRILQEARVGGDQGRMEWVASRLMGKVKDQVEISAKPFAVERLDGAQVVLGIEAGKEDDGGSET